jgi:hypothetical protein
MSEQRMVVSMLNEGDVGMLIIAQSRNFMYLCDFSPKFPAGMHFIFMFVWISYTLQILNLKYRFYKYIYNLTFSLKALFPKTKNILLKGKKFTLGCLFGLIKSLLITYYVLDTGLKLYSM